jgi:SAM-dependent methyltransferase
MKRLTDKHRWDLYYEGMQTHARGRARKVKFVGEGFRKYFCPYSDYFLWNVILKRYLPKTKGAKVLEVGSAPGDFLVGLHQIYGFTPYGVEYSEPGVAQNREVFRAHKIDPDNVIHADFFDDKFQQEFRGYFDIVISRGFIEHFTDVEDVVDKHVSLLAKGGCLFVSIPNLDEHSIYGMLASHFHQERLDSHNLNIMRKDAFAELFNRSYLSALFCDYYGTVRLSLMSGGNRNLLVRLAVSVCYRLERLLNPVFRIIFRDKGLDGRVFSPFLLYIGLKTAQEETDRQQR